MHDPAVPRTTASGAGRLLVCLLRARAATLAGERLRSLAWAWLGLAAAVRWPGLGRMFEAMEATNGK